MHYYKYTVTVKRTDVAKGTATLSVRETSAGAAERKALKFISEKHPEMTFSIQSCIPMGR